MRNTKNTTTAAEYKARTEAATIANIFAAKARHDKLVDEAIERTKRETGEEGMILYI